MQFRSKLTDFQPIRPRHSAVDSNSELGHEPSLVLLAMERPHHSRTMPCSADPSIVLIGSHNTARATFEAENRSNAQLRANLAMIDLAVTGTRMKPHLAPLDPSFGVEKRIRLLELFKAVTASKRSETSHHIL